MLQDAAGAVSARAVAKVDEATVIRAVQRGDQDAFEQLVRAYDQSVLRLAMNLLRSPEDARDVYQEAFLRVYRNIHTFRFDCSFHTWLYRIVTNICLDQLRKRKVRKEESPTIETSEGPMDRMDSFEEDPHACLACNADLTRQRALAATLNSRQMLPRPMLLEDCRSDLMAAIQG